jgi:TPR repeat protein
MNKYAIQKTIKPEAAEAVLNFIDRRVQKAEKNSDRMIGLAGQPAVKRRVGVDMDEKLETLYQLGKGLYETREYAPAALCFKEAAELFHPAAQCDYAHCLEWGLGTTASAGEALLWYERAAQLGDERAMRRLGDAARDGEWGSPDWEKAFGWYLKAAEKGDGRAMEYVAGCYFYGRGVKIDLAEAARWYQEAAEAGGEPAEPDIGLPERGPRRPVGAPGDAVPAREETVRRLDKR